MKKTFKLLEDTFAAVAFAEAGEAETAKAVMLGENTRIKKLESMKYTVDLTVRDLASMAITFAEAGQFETAEALMLEAEKNMESLKREYQGMFRQKNYSPA